jgi:ribosomal protein S18 acetylase RimI-like enzyme
MSDLLVRSYKPTDRAAVHRVAADTAFFGESVEAILEDRRLFCDALYSYYTDLEPQHCWVACVADEVVGFLAGSTDTAAQRLRWTHKVLPRVLGRVLRGRYRLGWLTWGYMRAACLAWLRDELPRVDLTAYPAHLHIGVSARWRGLGAGRRLIEAYLQQLWSLGVPGVHLHTTDRNEAACHLYIAVGFRLLDARRTYLWSHLVAGPVESRCYGLRPDRPEPG